jgi:sugar lactone lactonase YvrE
MPPQYVTAVQPLWAIEGGRISIHGSGFAIDDQLPEVRIGGVPARIVYASSRRVDALVPPGVKTGWAAVRLGDVEGEAMSIKIAGTFASELHQVDNPAYDHAGNLYVTYSGTRGQEVPVSIFRIHPNGMREAFAAGIVNPTSMAVDPEGRLYVSSRFEGTVYRLNSDGSAQIFATDLGVACGLAFAPDGRLFVGDRSGTVFEVDQNGRAKPFASLPASVAAFHLARGPDEGLYVTGPTLSSYDLVYRVDPDGNVAVFSRAFGRPQGLGFDTNGVLFVVEALAGASGVYRLPAASDPELVLSGPGLVGLAFSPEGGLVVCSNETAYRLA